MKFLILSLFILCCSCSTTYPNKSPLGEPFPSVTGQSLDKKDWKIPQDMMGEITLLLLGYKQNSQFDIDRWLIGLDQTKTKVTSFEVPTIQGLFPRMFKNSIDDGMRKGIPEPIWKAVITVYKDGDLVQKYTGNEKPNNARVLLLDPQGKVRFFHDQGFSVPALNDLKKKILESQKRPKKS